MTQMNLRHSTKVSPVDKIFSLLSSNAVPEAASMLIKGFSINGSPAVRRGIGILYGLQTEEEQAKNKTISKNGVGVSKTDAHTLMKFWKNADERGSPSNSQNSVSNSYGSKKEQMLNMCVRYSHQIVVYATREDLEFITVGPDAAGGSGGAKRPPSQQKRNRVVADSDDEDETDGRPLEKRRENSLDLSGDGFVVSDRAPISYYNNSEHEEEDKQEQNAATAAQTVAANTKHARETDKAKLKKKRSEIRHPPHSNTNLAAHYIRDITGHRVNSFGQLELRVSLNTWAEGAAKWVFYAEAMTAATDFAEVDDYLRNNLFTV